MHLQENQQSRTRPLEEDRPTIVLRMTPDAPYVCMLVCCYSHKMVGLGKVSGGPASIGDGK